MHMSYLCGRRRNLVLHVCQPGNYTRELPIHTVNEDGGARSRYREDNDCLQIILLDRRKDSELCYK